MMDLRSAFFAASNAKKERISLELNGEMREMELRDPSLAMRKKIMKEAQSPDDQIGGMGRAAVWTVIACLYDPETGKPVFKPEDFVLLHGADNNRAEYDTRPEPVAVARLVQKVALAAAPLLRLGAGEEEMSPMEVAEKNSQTTPRKP